MFPEWFVGLTALLGLVASVWTRHRARRLEDHRPPLPRRWDVFYALVCALLFLGAVVDLIYVFRSWPVIVIDVACLLAAVNLERMLFTNLDADVRYHRMRRRLEIIATVPYRHFPLE
ncbi:MAG TPA: hypothetical protein VI322_00475 [Candidatus Saccharimonadia bacterium]